MHQHTSTNFSQSWHFIQDSLYQSYLLPHFLFWAFDTVCYVIINQFSLVVCDTFLFTKHTKKIINKISKKQSGSLQKSPFKGYRLSSEATRFCAGQFVELTSYRNMKLKNQAMKRVYLKCFRIPLKSSKFFSLEVRGSPLCSVYKIVLQICLLILFSFYLFFSY
mgnify:CR=1 FL=1